MTADAGDVVAHQRARLAALYARHVGPGDAYALVDLPDHPNVGDSAIWLGEIALLRAATGRDPAYVSRWHDFDEDAFRAACPHGPLFIHGGGNLGDIWPHHQHFRERLLATVRDRAIVQLPQSICFRDPAAIGRFAALVADHPDVTLYVRDVTSLAIAARHVPGGARLAPDSAFALTVRRPAAASRAVLMLLRTDGEMRVDRARAIRDIACGPAVDWLQDDAMPANDGSVASYRLRAQARVERGIALLSRGRRIVTDRLHGHILATLLGIPHVALDNDYGKVSAYIDAWTASTPLVRVAASPAEAAVLLAAPTVDDAAMPA